MHLTLLSKAAIAEMTHADLGRLQWARSRRATTSNAQAPRADATVGNEQDQPPRSNCTCSRQLPQ